MKVNRTISRFMFSRIKKVLKNMYGKHALGLVKKAKVINKELLGKVDNITNNNPLAPKIQVAFPIIALWLASDKNIKPDRIGEIMYKSVDSLRVRWHCRNINLNNEKHLKKYFTKIKRNEGWAKKHSKESYSWRFSFDDSLHKEGCYYSVNFCPIADFCIKNNLAEIAPVLCKIDYFFVQLRHGNLLRKKTIASGDNMCDFWIVGDEKPLFIKW